MAVFCYTIQVSYIKIINMGFKESFRGLKEGFIQKAAAELADKAKGEAGGLDLTKACALALKNANIKIDYLKMNKPEFQENRLKLQTQGGLVISNHPGRPDIFAVLQTLDRDDVLVMTKPQVAQTASKLFGPKYFLPASHEPRQLVRDFSKIKEHICKGGLFVLFPTGGGKREFQPGFRVLLERIPADAMVYCFNVNNEDVRKASGSIGRRMAGAVSEEALNFIKNPYFLAYPAVVRVDETYTQAAEWQKLLAGIPKNQQDEVLRQHYEKKFC